MINFTSVSALFCVLQFITIAQCKPETSVKQKVRKSYEMHFVFLYTDEPFLIDFEFIASGFHKSRIWSEQRSHDHERWAS